MTQPARLTVTYAIGVVAGFIVFASLGYKLSVGWAGENMEAADVGAALDFTFGVPSEGGWAMLEGTVDRGVLTRRSYVSGIRASTGSRFSEQVVKVGWPFTMTRGFVRTSEGETSYEGAVFVHGDAASGPIKFMPVQPVWPGVLVDGLLIGGIGFVISGLFRRAASGGDR